MTLERIQMEQPIDSNVPLQNKPACMNPRAQTHMERLIHMTNRRLAIVLFALLAGVFLRRRLFWLSKSMALIHR